MKRTDDLTKASTNLLAAIFKLFTQIAFLIVIITGLITIVVNGF